MASSLMRCAASSPSSPGVANTAWYAAIPAAGLVAAVSSAASSASFSGSGSSSCAGSLACCCCCGGGACWCVGLGLGSEWHDEWVNAGGTWRRSGSID